MKNFLKFKSNYYSKGFTLIELLVVIAVLGILAVGLISTIDPADKIKASNDTKVLNDIGLIGRAAENYAAQNSGDYPANENALTTSGNLKSMPVPPSGYGAAYTVNYTTAPTSITVTGTLKSKKYPAGSVALYDSVKGKLCTAVQTTPALTTCP